MPARPPVWNDYEEAAHQIEALARRGKPVPSFLATRNREGWELARGTFDRIDVMSHGSHGCTTAVVQAEEAVGRFRWDPVGTRKHEERASPEKEQERLR